VPAVWIPRGDMNPHLDFLLSCAYDRSDLHPEHLADLRKSGITDETRALQKIRSVPPDMIDALAGRRVPAAVTSAYVIPFPDRWGGWLDHVRMRLFPEVTELRGDHVTEHRGPWRYNGGRLKYLVRRHSEPRLFFALRTMRAALDGPDPVWIAEGPKKALALSQLGLPAVAIESAWSWHPRGSRALLPDFAQLALKNRIVELVPDGDLNTNTAIAWSLRQLADALRAVGARPRLVRLPRAASA
jgi:hypothetical protein